MRSTIIAALVVLGGCRPTVGDACDMDAARAIVHNPARLPAYAGQAMLINSCAGGGTHCHSSIADVRYGTPYGLNFDPVIVDVVADQSTAEQHLYDAQWLAYDMRDDVYAEVVSGAMPPGAIGDAVFPAMNVYAYDDGTPVPSVHSAEGRELLRNWLACGAPVIEGTVAPPPAPCTTDADCTRSHLCLDGTCDTIGVVLPAAALSTDWQTVYTAVLGPSCAVSTCHGAAASDANGMLDLSTADRAYAGLVGVAASDAACGTRIAPGDPEASLLVQKVQGTQSRHCGHRMPSAGATLTAAQIETIRTWIANGAAR